MSSINLLQSIRMINEQYHVEIAQDSDSIRQ